MPEVHSWIHPGGDPAQGVQAFSHQWRTIDQEVTGRRTMPAEQQPNQARLARA